MPIKLPNETGLKPLLPSLNGSNSVSGMSIYPRTGYYQNNMPWHAFADDGISWDTDPNGPAIVDIVLNKPITVDVVKVQSGCGKIELAANGKTIIISDTGATNGSSGIYLLDEPLTSNNFWMKITRYNSAWVLVNRIQFYSKGGASLLSMDGNLYSLVNGEFTIADTVVENVDSVIDTKGFTLSNMNVEANGKKPITQLSEITDKFKVYTKMPN